MDSGKTQALGVTLILFEFLMTVYGQNMTGSYGGWCIDKCDDHGTTYHYCKTTTHNWDYCSPVKGVGAYGNACNGACKLYNNNYYYCDTSSSWDYCSGTYADSRHYGYTRYGQRCTTDCWRNGDTTYYWCYYSGSSWEYCSPHYGFTYQNESCRAGHLCQKHGESYYWCYTDANNNWDYCGQIDSCFYSEGSIRQELRRRSETERQNNLCPIPDYEDQCLVQRDTRSDIIFGHYPGGNARISRANDRTEHAIQRFIASLTEARLYSRNSAGTAFQDSITLRGGAQRTFRIDFQGTIIHEGRRYVNYQIQSGSETYAGIAVLYNSIAGDADFPIRLIRRALNLSLRSQLFVYVDIRITNPRAGGQGGSGCVRYSKKVLLEPYGELKGRDIPENNITADTED